MRKSRPVRWIEEVEARQFRVMALSERPSPPPPSLAQILGIRWVRGRVLERAPPAVEQGLLKGAARGGSAQSDDHFERNAEPPAKRPVEHGHKTEFPIGGIEDSA